MFNFNNTPHSEALDARIAELLEELESQTGSNEDYTATTKNLATLLELKDKILKTGNETTKVENDRRKIDDDIFHAEEELRINQRKINLDEERFAADQEKERSWKPSADAVVGAAASVVGILLVLNYEKLGVVTSKALSFVGKMKN